MADLHVGDIGKTLRCNCSVDLVDVASAVIKYYDPNGVQGFFPGTIESPTTDGYITYKTTSVEDLFMSGKWRFWAYVTMNDAGTIASDMYETMVYEQGVG